MRFPLALFVTCAVMLAQQPAPRAYTGAAEVTTMIEKAKKERKPDQGNFIQPLIQVAPYGVVNLESRVQGIDTNPNVHETEAELIYVVEGACTFITGGTLKNEKRTNAANRTGTGIEGGTPRRISKGDWVLVPEGTAHAFTKTEGSLVIASLHFPKPAGK